MPLETKDLITITLSSVALLLSGTTFFVNILHKQRDNLRTFRKELTEVMKEIVETNIAIAKIEMEGKVLTNKIYDIRRNFNTRRRYLIARAEFLIKDIPKYIDHIDLSTIAQACIAGGMHDRADRYFLQALQMSPKSIELIFNMRGYARFLYQTGRHEEGEKIFEDVVHILEYNTINISNSVRLRELCDTFIMFSRAEFYFGNKINAKEIYLKAKSILSVVKQPLLWDELYVLLKENSYLDGNDSSKGEDVPETV
ncbi:hypothetical protein [uncultured Hymenobacter sp.]|uniref:hypothetical protein n=1 Tax=uncultured Hymenobacter sp. TaxID=170016 RepID=UPI0035CC8DD7